MKVKKKNYLNNCFINYLLIKSKITQAVDTCLLMIKTLILVYRILVQFLQLYLVLFLGFTGGYISDSMKEGKYNEMMTDI